MKHLFIYLFAVAFTILAFSKCQEYEPYEEKETLDLTGEWIGTTSQRKEITIKVSGYSIQKVSSYSINVHVSGGGWSADQYLFGNISSYIKENEFDFNENNIELRGEFLSSNQLKGNFKITTQSPNIGYSDATAYGTFTAKKSN